MVTVIAEWSSLHIEKNLASEVLLPRATALEVLNPVFVLTIIHITHLASKAFTLLTVCMLCPCTSYSPLRMAGNIGMVKDTIDMGGDIQCRQGMCR